MKSFMCLSVMGHGLSRPPTSVELVLTDGVAGDVYIKRLVLAFDLFGLLLLNVFPAIFLFRFFNFSIIMIYLRNNNL